MSANSMDRPTVVPTAPMLPLREVAQVRGGYVTPVAPSSLATGAEISLLQGSDVDFDGTVKWKDLRRTRLEADLTRYAIREGDILLSLRSARLFASVAKRLPGIVIASGQWALITLDPSRVNADFVAWYLNHPDTASRLGRLAQGTKLQFLSLATLREFPVPVPPLELQKRIASVNTLHTRLVALERELAEARARLVNALTIDALHRASDPTPIKDA
jgi:hypothetical protein